MQCTCERKVSFRFRLYLKFLVVRVQALLVPLLKAVDQIQNVSQDCPERDDSLASCVSFHDRS